MIFELVFTKGYFFKHLMDFISACTSTNKCWLRILNTGINLEYAIKNSQNEVISVVYLDLPRENFQTYTLIKEISILIEPKQIQKLCKNIKKRDSLKLKFFEENNINRLQLIIANVIENMDRVETKSIIIDSVYDEMSKNITMSKLKEYEKPDTFYDPPFILNSSLVQNFKKGVGTKKEDVILHLNTNKYLKFQTHSQDIASMEVEYGKPCEPNTIITLVGSLINILNKLTNLTNHIKWYDRVSKIDPLLIKISAHLDIPNYMGTIDLFVHDNKK